VLAWAASEGRIILTRDVNTLIGFAWDRVRAGQPMPGVFATWDDAPVGRVIDDLLLLSECSDLPDWDGQLRYLPL
jgi:hypothetical protein